jgi:hypothetical protein
VGPRVGAIRKEGLGLLRYARPARALGIHPSMLISSDLLSRRTARTLPHCSGAVPERGGRRRTFERAPHLHLSPPGSRPVSRSLASYIRDDVVILSHVTSLLVRPGRPRNVLRLFCPAIPFRPFSCGLLFPNEQQPCFEHQQRFSRPLPSDPFFSSRSSASKSPTLRPSPQHARPRSVGRPGGREAVRSIGWSLRLEHYLDGGNDQRQA